MTSDISVVQLYPATMAVTGDAGNVRALTALAERAGLGVSVSIVEPGDAIAADADVVVMGNGPLSAMRHVLADLRVRKSRLEEFVDSGGVLLAIGGSAEMLAHSLTTLDNETIQGLGLIPAHVSRVRDRRVGYIGVETPFGQVLGFEDHASEWTLDDDAITLGTVVAGKGSFAVGDRRGEIIRVGNLFASYVQGPALPLNPAWTAEILRVVAERRGHALAPVSPAATDAYAAGARSAIEALLESKGPNTIGL